MRIESDLDLVIIRGLKQISATAYASFEDGMSEENPRWSRREVEEMKRAFAWIRQLDATTRAASDCGSLIRCNRDHKGHPNEKHAIECRTRDQRSREIFRAVLNGERVTDCARRLKIAKSTVNSAIWTIGHSIFRNVFCSTWPIEFPEREKLFDEYVDYGKGFFKHKQEYLNELDKIEKLRIAI